MYTYETLLGIVIQHPDTVPLKDNVRFVASEETTQILSKYGLIMKPTNTGFVITYKTSTTFNETKDTEGNVVFTPSGSINWLDIPTLDISLEFFCIANKKFIKNTDWEELGPREKKENEVTVIYSYNRYSA